jgi:putative oxidoreductase
MNARDLALLVLRLGLGTIMFAHGSQKFLGWFGGPGPEGFLGFMAQAGVPPILGWLAIIAEFFGGIGVILGVLPRLSALGFACNMAVATFMVHWKNGFFMSSDPDRGDGWEFTFMLFCAALAIVLAGPGRFSLFGGREFPFPKTQGPAR